MSLDTTTRRLDYIGDDVTKTFPYTFKVFNADHLVVYRVFADGSATLLARGLGYTVTGVGSKAGGLITLTTALLDKQGLIILGRMPLKQETDIRNQGEYYPATLEDTFDIDRMIDQQLDERISRRLAFPVQTRVDKFSTTVPAVTSKAAYKVWRFNADATAIEYVDASELTGAGAGGASGKLGLPTDLTYGGPLGNPAKVAELDTYEDAFDKVATLLSKLVPTPPDDLRNKVLTLIGSYQGLEAGSGTLHLLTDVSNPVITPGLGANIASGFADPDAGTLTGLVDSVSVGLVTLTAGDNTGLTNGQLLVIAEFDPYAGQGFGRQDIFKAISARIQAAGLVVGAHSAQMVHSTTGGTAVLAFYVDDPATPTASVTSVGASGFTPIYKSGVPGLPVGAALSVPVSVSNAIRTHYRQGAVARVTSAFTTTVDLSPATPPAANATFTATAAPTVASNVYSEDIVMSVVGYNSKGVASATATGSGNVRVDTVGSEAARLTSGTGQYPTTGYGNAYDSTTLLSSTKGLQYINGRYRYPALVSYAAKIPAGPDYSGLTPDTYANMRWVTFTLGTVTNAAFVLFTVQNSLNWGTDTLISGVAMYVRVDGAAPTAGWIDANAAYPGVGSPSANGDPALDVGNSNFITRRVTFGATVRTGQVFVRIGIPSGSTKSFGGIA